MVVPTWVDKNDRWLIRPVQQDLDDPDGPAGHPPGSWPPRWPARPSVVGDFLAPSRPRTFRRVTLRVMTWNLWWRFGPWEERQPAIEAVVAEQRPTCCCSRRCGARATASIAARLAGVLASAARRRADRRTAGRADGGVGFHNAIVSRWPLDRGRRAAAADAPTGRPGTGGSCSPTWPRRGVRGRCASTHLDYQFDQSARAPAAGGRGARRGGRPPRRSRPPTSRRSSAATSTPSPTATRSAWSPVGAAPPRAGCAAQRLLGARRRRVRVARGGGTTRTRSTRPGRNAGSTTCSSSWPRPKPVGNPVAAWLAGVDPVDGVVPSDHAAVVVELPTP